MHSYIDTHTGDLNNTKKWYNSAKNINNIVNNKNGVKLITMYPPTTAWRVFGNECVGWECVQGPMLSMLFGATWWRVVGVS